MKSWPVLIAIALSACGTIPRDPEGTLDRVRASHMIRVGVVTGPTTWRPLLARIAAVTQSRPHMQPGALEPLLLQLEEGELDLVVGGQFAADSPWAARVTLGPAIRRDPTINRHLVARNGENAWIMLIEREARALGHGT